MATTTELLDRFVDLLFATGARLVDALFPRRHSELPGGASGKGAPRDRGALQQCFRLPPSVRFATSCGAPVAARSPIG